MTNTTSSISTSNTLISEEYESILYLSIFVPFISPNTPIIRRSELEKAQENTSAPLTKRDLAFILHNPSFNPMPSQAKDISYASSRRSLPAISDNYSKLMKAVVQKEHPRTIPEIIRKKKKVNRKRMNYSIDLDLIRKMPPLNNFKRLYDSVPRSSKREISLKRDLSESVRGRSNSVSQSLNRTRIESSSKRLDSRVRGEAKLLYLSPTYQAKQLSGTVMIKPNYFNPAKKERHLILELSQRMGSRDYSAYNVQPNVNESNSGHISTFTNY